ncbi:hypothetical protein BH09MYX1_BH09MYX1_54900 [soil metagenome]
MTNAPLVTRKLSVLNDHLARLRARRPADVTVYVADTLLQDAVAMSLLVIVQEAMDIALHIASDHGGTWPRRSVTPSTYWRRTAWSRPRLGATAQLRNRIAHG